MKKFTSNVNLNVFVVVFVFILMMFVNVDDVIFACVYCVFVCMYVFLQFVECS
jgi:hypothetical protein